MKPITKFKIAKVLAFPLPVILTPICFIAFGIKGIINQWTIYFTLSIKDVVNDNTSDTVGNN
jgi:cellobiose-specific phosphotransferase system component IIC